MTSYDKPRQHTKKQRHYFADKDSYNQRYGLSSSYVWVWELDHKENWAPKNWCFATVVLKSLRQQGDQTSHCAEADCAEAETPKLHPHDAKNWLTGKYTDDRGRSKAGREGDNREWDGWMASLTWRAWVWASSGSWWWTRSLACCSPRGCKEVDTTEALNWTDSYA